MATWSPLVRTTNWQAIFVSSLIPLFVAAGLVYAAAEADWDDSPQWLYGIAALIPLEFVRALVLSILGDTFRNYRGRTQAVAYFLSSMAILAVLLLAFAGYLLGWREFIKMAGDLQTWKFVLPLAGILIADGFITLYFFSGDPGAQAARLEAASDDVGDLLGLMLYPTPIVIIVGYGLLMLMRQNGVAFLADLPDPSLPGLRTLALYWFALYFVGKAGVFAYVQSYWFNRSGERLFGGSWLTWLRGRNAEQRVRDLHEEQSKATRRRAALGLNDFRH
jgi:hypothetical protein